MRLFAMHALWLKIALLGDLTFLVPAFILVCVALWYFGKRRELATLSVTFLTAIAVIGLLKGALNPFHLSFLSMELHAKSVPSGHAGMSTLFYGQLAARLSRLRPAWAKVIAALPIGIAAAVSISVWFLGWHSRFDIACGVVIGAAFLAISDRLGRRASPASVPYVFKEEAVRGRRNPGGRASNSLRGVDRRRGADIPGGRRVN